MYVIMKKTHRCLKLTEILKTSKDEKLILSLIRTFRCQIKFKRTINFSSWRERREKLLTYTYYICVDFT